MSDTLPEEVREAMARAIAGEGMPLGYFANGAPMRATTWADHTDQTKAEAFAAADAALSALEAAGFEVNRKGTIDH